MPDVPMIDAHLHLWDPAKLRISWIEGDTALDRPFMIDEYARATAGLPIEAMVYVQVDVDPAYALIEAQQIEALAASDGRIQGIVAYAPLEHADVARTYLDALVAVGPRIKGVRRILQGEADDRYCLHPGFVRGVQLLAEYGLSFDICVRHTQLAGVVELVRQCPDVAFMLDHVGKPGIRAGELDPWRAQIAELAVLPNVLCKISGMVNEANHAAWQPDDLAPYLDHVLDAFGEDRVAFGGDWPVIILASSYARWVATLDALLAPRPDSLRQKLYAENARRFYRLGQGASSE